jgi:hypothetical protein
VEDVPDQAGLLADRVLRRKRVRLHFKPNTGMDASLEGVMGMTVGDKYVLLVPSLIEQADASVSLGRRVEVPRENVLFWEVLSR